MKFVIKKGVNIMGLLKDFNDQSSENKNLGASDCVGMTGHCPIVTAVEDCTTFVMSDSQKKLAEIKNIR